MKVSSILIVFLITQISSVNAEEIYRCKNSKGKLEYSDQPCSDSAEKIEVDHAPAYEHQAPYKKWQSVTNSVDVREINRDISRRKRMIFSYQNELNAQIDELSYKKSMAANNLAGANWELSLSKEMDVVERRYNSLIKNEEVEINLLREKLKHLENQ